MKLLLILTCIMVSLILSGCAVDYSRTTGERAPSKAGDPTTLSGIEAPHRS